MAESDWTFMEDGLADANVVRGVTGGLPTAPGGGQFLYGFNSLSEARGAVALRVNGANFHPLEKGGSIRGCVKRGEGPGATGFSPFLFLGAQGKSVNDTAYLLGLSDEEPSRIVLRKGALAVGIPSSDGPGVLLKSSPSFMQGEWLHLRLDMIVNANGDVVLRCLYNDLKTHPLNTAPDWKPIPGMLSFEDDRLRVNSGSAPLLSGHAGFGFETKAMTRRGYFGHLEIHRQL